MAFGHSWVAGRYPERWVRPWPERAAARLGMRVHNAGVGGIESPDVARLVLAYVPRPGDVVAVAVALNDARRLGDTDAGLARYRAALCQMLRYLAATPTPPTVLMLLDPPIAEWAGHPGHDGGSPAALAAYAAASREVAAEHGAHVIDLWSGWDLDKHVSHDGVHPNTAGMRHISDAVVAAIRMLRAAEQCP
jgi:lysophospholipase L1-like esterase